MASGLAAASRALLGDAGTHLEWLVDARAFATPVIAGKSRLAFAPAKLTLFVADASGVAAESFELAGKTSGDAEKWIAGQAGKHGAEIAADSRTPVVFASSDALEDLTRSFGNAHRALLCAAAMAKSDQPVHVAPRRCT